MSDSLGEYTIKAKSENGSRSRCAHACPPPSLAHYLLLFPFMRDVIPLLFHLFFAYPLLSHHLLIYFFGPSFPCHIPTPSFHLFLRPRNSPPSPPIPFYLHLYSSSVIPLHQSPLPPFSLLPFQVLSNPPLFPVLLFICSILLFLYHL